MRKKTHEEYIKEVNDINPNIIVVGRYVNYQTKILHKCKLDEHEWETTPANILKSEGCPMCRNRRLREARIKPHDEYVQSIQKLNPNIEVIETYVGAQRKIKHRCKIDNYEWAVTPSAILGGQGCPVCAGQKIGPAPEYKNSIWASQYKTYCSCYMTDTQMKTTMPMSSQKIDCICPNCHTTKSIIVANLIKQGLDCICEDGQTYPNKFVYNVLKQLNLNVKPECRFEWSNNKRYDDFLVDYNIIVENHGQQHYEECLLTYGTSLMDIQQNDRYKEQLARANGILEYVILDCRKSNADHIRRSILNSKLPEILHFADNDIDWREAHEYACTNRSKLAIDLYNQGETIKNIAKEFNVDVGTVRKWIKVAAEIGSCRYYAGKKPTYCVELDKTFESVTQAAKFLGQKHIVHIAECCRGEREIAYGYHWQYIT